jgi:tetratricopeptide (TPR) repeat protein
LLLPLLAGCLPDSSPVDDEKDPHFQEGRNLVNSQDYKGAMDEFEKALQANPHSAAAHFELALLSERQGDPAAAIYHYERVLALEPKSPHAPAARDRIHGCREALATAEFPLPNSQNLQKQVDQLTAENARLRQQCDELRAQLAARPTMAPPPAAAPAPVAVVEPRQAPVISRTPPLTASISPASQTQRPASGKIYTVRAGDTIAAIARRYGVKPNAVLAANPRLNPRKLRVGQTVNIP